MDLINVAIDMFKKITKRGIIICLFCFMMNSCSNDAIEITRPGVNVSVILNQVLSPFKAYRLDDLYMHEDDGIASKIKVVTLIYDDAGRLTDTHEELVSDYSVGQVTFTASVLGSNPTIVSFSFGTWTSAEGEVIDAYTITGQNLLSTLEIKADSDYSTDVFCIPWKVLGGSITSMGTASTVNTVLKPLGGLVYTNWQNIHSHDGDSPAPKYYVLMYENNDIAKVSKGAFVYSTSLLSSYAHISYIQPAGFSEYNNIYGIQFFLPGSFDIMAYGGYNDESGELKYTQWADTQQVTVDEGHQYVYALDCSNYSINFFEGEFN